MGDDPADMAKLYIEGLDSPKCVLDTLSGKNNRTNRLIADTSQLYDFLPKKRLRRVDHFSRMVLLAAGKAIADTDPGLICKDDTGVIVATGFGALQTTFNFLDSYIEKGDKLASPTYFSNSVHNAAAAHLSICYGITGPNLTVSQFDMSFVSALITAAAWLEEGKVNAVLLGTSEAFCDVLGYCIDTFSSTKNSQNYSFGESATFFMLTCELKNAKYGYFEKIRIGNYERDDLNIPQETLLLLSPSSTSICNDKFISFLKRHNKTLVREHLFSPTDSGLDVMFATKFLQKTCYIKIGQGGEYGKMIIDPILE
ncbi:MAG: beta-ketoacyl synthase chain length factor [Desulfobacula sp.]|nr:beta-ketoacyl synthase chain length factor [Desulfobacula sp.]